MPEDHFIDGTKVANIQVSTKYPIVSAFEFEFLKSERAVLERLDNCTIYMIAQRPLTYFDEVILKDGYIYFKISDAEHQPLACRINLVSAGICTADETVDIEVSFLSKTPGTEQPFRDVGAIKIYKLDGSFVVWWSPQKILYEMIVNDLPVEVDEDGDPYAFLDFKIHYIGKAFSQKVWDRLTGHDKMQRILTLQGPVGASPEAMAPFEISLILLSVVGLTDVPELNSLGLTIPDGAEPIVHKIDMRDEEALYRFMNEPLVALGDEAMTREVEAMLINLFKPAENDIQYKNYPNIEGGMRSKGYSYTGLTVEQLPAFLYSDHHAISATKPE
ncbi:hypothetical protein MCBMB27_05683 (plasmid) [Methylobacterium phyllosphaerae]|uniref:Uncharacterized protein n=1 Tax=Methylobacterium phyllosphaerae TaxID=418223 RepID=A0AAE8L9I7_9HYPH|nr:hypothetical protein [Methylobacterium phyllosphaerae]APT34974.1 hypothetical protein MCBMB27_05683 [Methylobacterium phyllosphaerae]SFH65784.1 hypothetical protein SAMN05192567_14026 [Methylobacterium phyllosphaerae]